MEKNWILLSQFVTTAAGTCFMLTETLAIMCARCISLRKIDEIIILLYDFFYLKVITCLTYMKAGKNCEQALVFVSVVLTWKQREKYVTEHF
jgi:hypothetical protein